MDSRPGEGSTFWFEVTLPVERSQRWTTCRTGPFGAVNQDGLQAVLVADHTMRTERKLLHPRQLSAVAASDSRVSADTRTGQATEMARRAVAQGQAVPRGGFRRQRAAGHARPGPGGGLRAAVRDRPATRDPAVRAGGPGERARGNGLAGDADPQAPALRAALLRPDANGTTAAVPAPPAASRQR